VGLAPGAWDLYAARDDLPGRRVDGYEVPSGGETRPVSFRLPRAVRLAGRVVDAGGAPRAGVHVYAHSPHGAQVLATVAAGTDAEGKFAFEAFDASATGVEVWVERSPGPRLRWQLTPSAGPHELRVP
jgi:hypothetical protein